MFLLKIENKSNNFSILPENKNNRIGEKKQMVCVIDEIIVSGLQNFEQYDKLNPIDIKIDDSQITSSLSKYRNYHLMITSLLLSASFHQTANVIFITYNGLNDTRKALINGKIYNILGVINLTEEASFDLIKGSSKWLNIIFGENN